VITEQRPEGNVKSCQSKVAKRLSSKGQAGKLKRKLVMKITLNDNIIDVQEDDRLATFISHDKKGEAIVSIDHIRHCLIVTHYITEIHDKKLGKDEHSI
jgi:hypothetical protein